MNSSDTVPRNLEKADYERLSNFRYQLRLFLRHSENICRASGLTPLQYQMLLHLRGAPGRDWLTIGELAERLQAQHHGVVALIDRCEKQQLVKRQPMQNDKRKVAVHLLPTGQELLSVLAHQHQQELQMLLAAFVLPPDGDSGAG